MREGQQRQLPKAIAFGDYSVWPDPSKVAMALARGHAPNNKQNIITKINFRLSPVRST